MLKLKLLIATMLLSLSFSANAYKSSELIQLLDEEYMLDDKKSEKTKIESNILSALYGYFLVQVENNSKPKGFELDSTIMTIEYIYNNIELKNTTDIQFENPKSYYYKTYKFNPAQLNFLTNLKLYYIAIGQDQASINALNLKTKIIKFATLNNL